MVPFPKDLNFIGRTDVLEAMQERFRNECNVALAGIGGVGKSQIAIHYCYSYQVQFPQRHVFWIHAGSTTRIDEGYRNIARGLSLPGWREPATDIHQVVDDWLLSVDNGPWLLVVDSADDMSVFFAAEPDIPGTKPQPITVFLRRIAQSSHGSLIITTRDKRLGRRLLNGSQPVEVPLMNDEDAKQLLRARGAGSSPAEVDTQALRLGEHEFSIGHLEDLF
ncbi:MAG: hypothetical protein FRX48_02701 [Lasallia pustulata]|uniref:NACHT domain-containing protein n=1 Tax=Lasallia pustulata TaxID=136370 RepID=A0A5M8Q090_9LECA|nr:MAG: hypothetical protein FRX48_02701 [Lasallia pustulata]